MKLKTLIGAGDQIIGCTLPFALIGIIANLLEPQFFRLNPGRLGTVLGLVLLGLGVPLWLYAVVQILQNVPQNKLITSGPFALMLHPLYTSVALLVLPGIALLSGNWTWLALGAVLYLWVRVFAVQEEQKLAEIFGAAYRTYRARVRWPWL